jgi:hypothetical protein
MDNLGIAISFIVIALLAGGVGYVIGNTRGYTEGSKGQRKP